jgi:hypothetical protein
LISKRFLWLKLPRNNKELFEDITGSPVFKLILFRTDRNFIFSINF